MTRTGILLTGMLAVAACAGPAREAETASPTPALERAARADSVRRHYTRADVDFMTGMIVHHAQALVMAGMAPSHGASEPLRTLAARIINGQNDEIALMQRWLRDRGEPVPEVDEAGRVSGHAGHAPGTMAGMLTPEQMRRLDAARGGEWDRLFLTYMIQHHQGALVMVDELFATHGAGQGDETFRIASGIGADQATEIDRMQRMLEERIFDEP
ncbi:MAG: DUF305 domain-containing protein [Gemmatimonadetes bacterium]|nr:DUF305 domain-containing protein [Gemmatimonadota bacterium]NIQ57542.1 DUF305 domain-containing protein [Gemmatimonadota bacterium]NIU77704.1 DUF305 domain-containing protein [Gammaproteobacteria bacterium]NIX46862.1 DUF305 domain-containing protein [Gemmatimonadota bacterium]NIY11208.1 DUF305 domain-containing protein [Gemmatimonadota bacterium]